MNAIDLMEFHKNNPGFMEKIMKSAASYGTSSVIGQHKDGSITLTPEVANYLRDLIKRSGGPFLPGGKREYVKLVEFQEFLHEKQGISFEVWS